MAHQGPQIARAKKIEDVIKNDYLVGIINVLLLVLDGEPDYDEDQFGILEKLLNLTTKPMNPADEHNETTQRGLVIDHDQVDETLLREIKDILPRSVKDPRTVTQRNPDNIPEIYKPLYQILHRFRLNKGPSFDYSNPLSFTIRNKIAWPPCSTDEIENAMLKILTD